MAAFLPLTTSAKFAPQAFCKPYSGPYESELRPDRSLFVFILLILAVSVMHTRYARMIVPEAKSSW